MSEPHTNDNGMPFPLLHIGGPAGGDGKIDLSVLLIALGEAIRELVRQGVIDPAEIPRRLLMQIDLDTGTGRGTFEALPARERRQ